jgi:membrane associated rhomboid family serine protease
MIPLKVDAVPTRFPIVTLCIIAMCAGAYLLREQMGGLSHGFVPVDFMHSVLHPGRPTLAMAANLSLSFFLHAGPLHLLSNMWYLWLFGSALEYRASRVAYITVYLACGVLSMVIQAASTPFSTIPVVGASGAIAGVMGAYLVLLPFSRVVLWLPPFFFFRIPAFFFLLLWFILQYVSMRLASHVGAGVAWWAHLGGYACGFLMALFIRRQQHGQIRARVSLRRAAASRRS